MMNIRRVSCKLFDLSKYTRFLLQEQLPDGHKDLRLRSFNKVFCICVNRYSDLRKSSWEKTEEKDEKEERLECLCRSLECNESQAKAVWSSCPALGALSVVQMKQMICVCKCHAISPSQLLRHPSLLLIPKPLLEWKLELLMPIGITDATIPLLFLPSVHLKRIAAVWKWDRTKGNDNRFRLLLNLLQCNEVELGNLLLKHHILLVKDFSQVKQVSSVLIKYNVPPENIQRDLWIFNNNVKLMEIRLKQLQEAGITDIKMWSLRCAEHIFKQFVNRFKTVQDILKPHTNKVYYLAEKLECSPEYIERQLLDKHRLLLKVQLPKLQNMLELLFAYKLTPEQILKAPRVLCMGVATVEKRLKELQKMEKYAMKSLYLLHTTRQRYEKTLEKLKQKQTNNN